jgi:uncharacterized membrane protein YqgA involved in biofilm formation|tara:strand:- start:299 stop:685 length:387 start_codon:yes stop_codon:yes gene_type:complete
MPINGLIKSLLYHLFTSGLFISITLVVLKMISSSINFVNVFAFASASMFLINLLQYNVVDQINPKASRGFIIHTLLGVGCYLILAVSMYILHVLNYSRATILTSLLSASIFLFLSYLFMYRKGLLNFN